MKDKVNQSDSRLSEFEALVKNESMQKRQLADENHRLQAKIQSREEYMLSLENETIMLRKEIKETKFNNEKRGY